MNSLLRTFLFAAVSLLASVPTLAQYPTKPIRLIVPFPPGGPSDIMAREVAVGLGMALGQPIVVENRPGANGVVGAGIVARAAPDGYTIMCHNTSSHLTNPWVYKQLPYDTINDFAPITQIASAMMVVVVNPNFPAKTMGDLIAMAKAKPGTISIASFGSGSMAHIGIEMLKSLAGIDVVHVPYKGGAPAVADTIAGHVPVTITGPLIALPHIQQGRLRALAVTGRSRSKQLRNVPTVSETPRLGAYEAATGWALWAPAKTPDGTIRSLHDRTVRMLRTPEILERLEKAGADEVIGNTPEQMAANMKIDLDKFGQLVKAAGIQPE